MTTFAWPIENVSAALRFNEINPRSLEHRLQSVVGVAIDNNAHELAALAREIMANADDCAGLAGCGDSPEVLAAVAALRAELRIKTVALLAALQAAARQV